LQVLDSRATLPGHHANPDFELSATRLYENVAIAFIYPSQHSSPLKPVSSLCGI